jgi:hypothetical protein
MWLPSSTQSPFSSHLVREGYGSWRWWELSFRERTLSLLTYSGLLLFHTCMVVRLSRCSNVYVLFCKMCVG